MKVHLLAIDPQIDFSLAAKNKYGLPGGSLFVPGADEDMERLASFLVKATKKIDDIHVTLDSHLPMHMAHPGMWIDSKGNPPKPFTLMVPEGDIINGYWVGGGGYDACGQFKTVRPMMFEDPTNPGKKIPWSLYYTRQLKTNGRYSLCVWPEHCLIGSIGAAIHPAFFEAISGWQRQRKGLVHFVPKGSNFRTEHYSAVRADVEDPVDPGTQLNMDLITMLQDPEIVDIIITGEALSHCMAFTVGDIADNFGEENIEKLVLMTDTTSSVQGFEKQGDEFVKKMTARGMRVTTTKDYLA